MLSINNIPHAATDASEEDLKLPPLIPLQPSSATTFSPAAVAKVLQAINGGLFLLVQLLLVIWHHYPLPLLEFIVLLVYFMIKV